MSSGPKTTAGIERSRGNALKHGLCASKLALPGEDPEALQLQQQAWIETLQPQNAVEVSAVEQAALADLRLKRYAEAETAIQTAQVSRACKRWDEQREDRVAALVARLADDPATVTRELKRFGHGCGWMLARWREIERGLALGGSLISTAHVDEAVRLLGGDPRNPQSGPTAAYSLRVWNAAIEPANVAALDWLRAETQRHDGHRVAWGDELPTPAESWERLVALVRREIDALERLERGHQDDETIEQEEAIARAMLPPDSPEGRLWLRYQASATSSFHRALKTLEGLQKQRLEDEERNEANEGAESQVSDDEETACAGVPNSVSKKDMARYLRMGDAEFLAAVQPLIDAWSMMPIAPVAPFAPASDGPA